MELEPKELARLAQLAALSVSDEEGARLAVELARILTAVAVLEAELGAAESPAAESAPPGTALRADVAQSSTLGVEVVAKAPDDEGGHFRVPPVWA